jgi:O-antigen ligase
VLTGFARFAARTNGLELAWIALWLATISFVRRSATESLGGAIDATHLQRFAFVALAALLVAATLGRTRAAQAEPLTLYLVYGLVALASTLWSASAVATAGKAAELFLAVLVVWQTSARSDAPMRLLRLIEWTMLVHGALLVAALGGWIAAPEVFSEPSAGYFRQQLAAPYMSSNGVAAIGATIAVFAFARFLMHGASDPRRWSWALLAAGFALFPFLAQGRTGIAILALGVSILMLRRRPSIAALIVFPAVAALGLMLLTELSTFVLRGQNPYQVETLSGRTRLWEFALAGIAERPWLGAGFGVGSREVFATIDLEGFGETISSVHNGPLEVLLGLGVAGFVVWLPAVLWAVGLGLRTLASGRELDVAILVVPWLARTTMSIGLGGWLDPMIGTFLAGAAYLALMRRSEARARRVVPRPPPPLREDPRSA